MRWFASSSVISTNSFSRSPRSAETSDQLLFHTRSRVNASSRKPRFERSLTTALLDAADPEGELDEGEAISVVDRFALQHRLPDFTWAEHGETLLRRRKAWYYEREPRPR